MQDGEGTVQPGDDAMQGSRPPCREATGLLSFVWGGGEERQGVGPGTRLGSVSFFASWLDG